VDLDSVQAVPGLSTLCGHSRLVNARSTAGFPGWGILGLSAVVAWGRANRSDGTAGDQPQGHSVRGNLASNVGIYQKQSSM
jgi:hypothetical protein